jgi:hypothetical protein
MGKIALYPHEQELQEQVENDIYANKDQILFIATQ